MIVISVVRRLLLVLGSAVGGYALKMFRLTVKRGWSVCIIAYNDNGCGAGRAALAQDGGCRLWPYALRPWPFLLYFGPIG